MAITMSTPARDAAANGVVDLIDLGSGDAEGNLSMYQTSGDTLLAKLPMTNPAFGASSTGVATASAITDDSSADATGTAGYFRLNDRDGGEVVRGSIGTSGQDLNLNTVSITVGGTVSVPSLTYTQPAS